MVKKSIELIIVSKKFSNPEHCYQWTIGQTQIAKNGATTYIHKTDDEGYLVVRTITATDIEEKRMMRSETIMMSTYEWCKQGKFIIKSGPGTYDIDTFYRKIVAPIERKEAPKQRNRKVGATLNPKVAHP